MNISLNWLKQYINLDLEVNKISEYLTDIGLEVDGITEFESIKGGLKGIVIGEVLACDKHPNADRLNVTKVDIGNQDILDIVCGAPNVKSGQKVPVATVGSVLYDGEESFTIKKSKIRGEVSEGMICGEDELGLGDTTDGIMVLDDNIKVGTLASEYFKVESDTIFEIGLTPNRSDAMGHFGVARDLKTALNYNGSNLELSLPDIKEFKIDNDDLKISVDIEDSELCPRYSGITISGVKIGTSPEWLQNRLQSIGLSPINNIVDITNFVLHETGQPLHAFDARKIKDNKVIVKRLKEKTKFTTLDEVERKLSSQDLMICNNSEAMCMAGVFGGLNSGVSDSTINIFLESAYFNSVYVRKTAKRHTLSTDSSFRFERGCDPNMTIYALKRTALLIKEIAGGEISSEIVDVYPNEIKHFEVELTYSKLDNLIGEKIERESVKSILSDLEIEVVKESDNGLSLRVPPFKVDVQREVDVIEEILRIYGFNTVKIPTKLNTSISHSEEVNSEKARNIISDLLSSNGFTEIMNNSLTKESYTNLISDLDGSHNVKILNPLSQDLNIMRQSMLFSGLENISFNINRKSQDLKFYEFGKTYHKVKEENQEKQHLMLLLTGQINSERWNENNNKTDFFVVKEKVEHILFRLGVTKIKSEKVSGYGFSKGLMYQYKKQRLVCFGKVDAKITKSFGVKKDVFYADFNWDLILDLIQNTTIKYSEVSKFPFVKRDLSLLIDNKVSFKELLKIAKDTEKNILKSVNLFDVYEGDKLPEGKKSYALSFILEDKTKTLTDKYIDKVMSKLISSYENKVGAEVRSK
ncbi:MAG: phenylalanine--tRNA ligase subunit beta [Flavobacteriales bacterium]|nr:phenylalanine--tRNA ligase subunit beta [Flavobacteriales bacterium]|tara:strand:- start:10959 stop:13388 length:2430 start_codon:yes stop_codon:yes gene_type:complete